jgi:HK97 family phage prohead protease
MKVYEQKQNTCSINHNQESGFFSGYASVFSIIDNHNDVIMPGSFSNAINNHKNIKLLWQHKEEQPIGQILHLEEDSYGLKIEARLLRDVQQADEAYVLIKEGAIKGLSIGYRVKDFIIDPNEGVRYIKEIELFEVSLVTFPANNRAEITAVKSLNTPHPRKDISKLAIAIEECIYKLT